jgi:acetolactate synthase-1/2/3 large subunit
MNCNELATISHYRLPLLILVMNNASLGMVRQWQTLFFENRLSHTIMDRPPDFVKLADAYGVAGFRAVDESGFKAALDEALKIVNSGSPALIDCMLQAEENVFPMVPSGASIDVQITALPELYDRDRQADD